MRRVVVTGLGMVTPLACGVEKTWERLIAGQSGAGPITRFDASNVVTQYACEIPMGDGSDGTFNPDDWMEPKDRRKVDDFILYGVAAAVQAVRDSGWEPVTEDDRCATGGLLGSGIGGLSSIAETAILIRDKGPKRVSPFFIPAALINLISGQVSIRFGFKGPNHAVVTACSTGAHAIGDAARLIQWGDADVMIAGDLIVATNLDGLNLVCKETTRAVANFDIQPTSEFIHNRTRGYRGQPKVDLFAQAVRELGVIHAEGLAEEYLYDALYSNMILLGFAWQRGLVPVSLRGLYRAIKLNGVAIDENVL
ncbi:MAG: beta-ketoacyl synthase N-terminal-like domain-containing protein, partial [Cereibacter sp.]